MKQLRHSKTRLPATPWRVAQGFGVVIVVFVREQKLAVFGDGE